MTVEESFRNLILVDAGAGGYDLQVGFIGKPGKKLPVVAEHARGDEVERDGED